MIYIIGYAIYYIIPYHSKHSINRSSWSWFAFSADVGRVLRLVLLIPLCISFPSLGVCAESSPAPELQSAGYVSADQLDGSRADADVSKEASSSSSSRPQASSFEEQPAAPP